MKLTDTNIQTYLIEKTFFLLNFSKIEFLFFLRPKIDGLKVGLKCK